VAPYHANVPSFGEWGWHLALPVGGAGASGGWDKIQRMRTPLPHPWATADVVRAAFVFGKTVQPLPRVQVNTLTNPTLYRTYLKDWAAFKP
jgi:spermidine synthase